MESKEIVTKTIVRTSRFLDENTLKNAIIYE